VQSHSSEQRGVKNFIWKKKEFRKSITKLKLYYTHLRIIYDPETGILTSTKVSGFLAECLYFERIKTGLCDLLVACVSVCLYPPRQHLNA
jgi:hypothetical protein